MDEPLIISGKRDLRLQNARRCPFCNSSFLVFQSGPESKIWRRPTWRVCCVACSTKGPVAGSHKRAVKQWNGVPLFGTPLTVRAQSAAKTMPPHDGEPRSVPEEPSPPSPKRLPHQTEI